MIILDAKSHEPMVLIAVAAVILALSGGYFLVKKSHRKEKKEMS